MTRSLAFAVSRGLLMAYPLVLIAWDLYAYLAFGHTVTESHAMWTWGLVAPWFPPAIGALGIALWIHFFWGYWRGRTPENLGQ